MDLIGKPGAAEAHPELEILLGDLAKTKLLARKSDRISTYDIVGELPVRPIYKKVKPMSTHSALAKVQAKRGYSGIRYDVEGQCMVATDGDALIVYPSNLEGESRTVEPETGTEIYGDYPNYKSVIPAEWSYESGALKVADLLATARGAVRAQRFIDGWLRMVIETPEGFVTLASTLVERSLEAAYLAGAREVKIHANTFIKLIWFECEVLDLYIMPLVKAGDSQFSENDLLFKRLTHKTFSVTL